VSRPLAAVRARLPPQVPSRRKADGAGGRASRRPAGAPRVGTAPPALVPTARTRATDLDFSRTSANEHAVSTTALRDRGAAGAGGRRASCRGHSCRCVPSDKAAGHDATTERLAEGACGPAAAAVRAPAPPGGAATGRRTAGPIARRRLLLRR